MSKVILTVIAIAIGLFIAYKCVIGTSAEIEKERSPQSELIYAQCMLEYNENTLPVASNI